MAKIITAIIEENILKKINKNKITENKNILYKEAILDVLKKNKKIDTIIISEKIPGEINFIKLIKLNNPLKLAFSNCLAFSNNIFKFACLKFPFGNKLT